MDGHLFDDLARNFVQSRRTLLGALAAGSALAAAAASAKKKKKKPCKKKCKDGCCTGKHGKCIKPAQQSSTRCGTGGEICRTNCEGTVCDADCPGCCHGTTCVESYSDAQCGAEGDACFPCAAGRTCIGHACCGNLGSTCNGSDEFCCIGLGCEDDACCVNNNQQCSESSDCCKLGAAQICDNGTCVIPNGSSCQPGWMCQGNLPCPGSGICGDPGDCTVPCAELGQCSEKICIDVLNCCTQATFDECSGSQDFCGCITEGGDCTRIHL